MVTRRPGQCEPRTTHSDLLRSRLEVRYLPRNDWYGLVHILVRCGRGCRKALLVNLLISLLTSDGVSSIHSALAADNSAAASQHSLDTVTESPLLSTIYSLSTIYPLLVTGRKLVSVNPS